MTAKSWIVANAENSMILYHYNEDMNSAMESVRLAARMAMSHLLNHIDQFPMVGFLSVRYFVMCFLVTGGISVNYGFKSLIVSDYLFYYYLSLIIYFPNRYEKSICNKVMSLK